MSKEEELARFKVELEKQIKKGNQQNEQYCRINIVRLEKESRPTTHEADLGWTPRHDWTIAQ